MEWEVIVALLAGVGGLATGLAAVWRVRAQNTQAFASAGQQVSAAATELVASIREQLQDLRQRVEVLEAENQKLRRQLMKLKLENEILRRAVQRLVYQIQSLGADPVVDADILHADESRTRDDETNAE